MSKAIVIEVAGTAVGLVVRQPRGVQFFAADPSANRLEGQVFANAAAATRAARDIVSRTHAVRSVSDERGRIGHVL